MRRLGLTFFALTCLTAWAPACSSAPAPTGGHESDIAPTEDAQGNSPAPAPSSKGSTPPSGSQAATCPYTGPPIDVSGFATCSDGGRCVPTAVIPADQRSRLSQCPNGYCVPEKIIKAQGVYLPKSCRSVAGGEGRCTSIVFPDMAAQKDQLPIDSCDSNERCAPCYNPVDGKETGACRSVSCDAPKEPAKVFGNCCGSRGRCVPKSTMPPQATSGLDKKECTDAQDLCVPGEMMDPKYVPPKCKASALIGSYDGVCMSDCIPRDFLAQMGTAQGNCGQGFFCAPCKNPLTGQSTGAPGCGP